jgi:hypothetical protein
MADVIEIARLFLFVREAGENRGLRVEAIQHWSTGEFGDSWCAEFATMVLDLLYQGASSIPRLSAAQAIRDVCVTNGWETETPSVGDLFFYVDANDHAHHVGFVTSVDPLIGIAGNTSEDGTSSDGTGVFEHAISATHFARHA